MLTDFDGARSYTAAVARVLILSSARRKCTRFRRSRGSDRATVSLFRSS
jgi:hypothetical protein